MCPAFLFCVSLDYNVNGLKSTWVRDLLLANGLGYAWFNQGVGNKIEFIRRVEQRETDIDISL